MRCACAMWDGGGGTCAELCHLHSCSWLSSITARQLGAGARPLRHSSATRDSSSWCCCDSSSWRGRGSSSWRAGVRARRRGGSLRCAGRRWSRRRCCSRRGMTRCATRCGCSKARLSSRHGWPRATASTRAPRKAVPHCAAHANDAVGRVGQARAHRARGVGGRRRGRGRRRRDEGGVRAAARTRLHERPPPGLGCASAPLGAGSAHPRDGAPPSGEALPTVPRRAHSCCSPVASVGSWRGGGRAVPVGGGGRAWELWVLSTLRCVLCGASWAWHARHAAAARVLERDACACQKD